MPRSSTSVVWLVLLVPTHLAQCWLFRLCSLLCRQAQGFRLPGGFDQGSSFVVSIPQEQFLDKDLVFLTGAVVQGGAAVAAHLQGR